MPQLLHSYWSNCPLLFLSNILYIFQPAGFMFWNHLVLSFHTVHGFLMARILSVLLFPFPVNQVLSEHFTITGVSWIALNSMVQSFIELHKLLCQKKAVIHEVDRFSMQIIILNMGGLHPINQCSSVAHSFLTLCYPMDCSTTGFPVHYQLPELAQSESEK